MWAKVGGNVPHAGRFRAQFREVHAPIRKISARNRPMWGQLWQDSVEIDQKQVGRKVSVETDSGVVTSEANMAQLGAEFPRDRPMFGQVRFRFDHNPALFWRHSTCISRISAGVIPEMWLTSGMYPIRSAHQKVRPPGARKRFEPAFCCGAFPQGPWNSAVFLLRLVPVRGIQKKHGNCEVAKTSCGLPESLRCFGRPAHVRRPGSDTLHTSVRTRAPSEDSGISQEHRNNSGQTATVGFCLKRVWHGSRTYPTVLRNMTPDDPPASKDARQLSSGAPPNLSRESNVGQIRPSLAPAVEMLPNSGQSRQTLVEFSQHVLRGQTWSTLANN